MNLDKLTVNKISQILNDKWFSHIEQTFDIEDEIDRILTDEWQRKNYGETIERLTMYALFKLLIAKFNTQILDSPNLCKLGFVRYGFSENDLEVRLFFLLLDKNIPLESRKLTHMNKNFTSYSLSVSIYAKIFGAENLSNEYESILIKQINLIVNVLEQEQIIQLDFKGKSYKEKHRNFSCALSNIIQLYGTEILLDTKKLNAVFKDIAEPDDISNDMNHFLQIIEEVNKGETDFSHEPNKYYLEMFYKIISEQNKQYAPLNKAYNAYLKRLEEQELKQKQQEQHAAYLKKQEEEREQKFWEEWEEKWQKKERRTRIITKIIRIIILVMVFAMISGIVLTNVTGSDDFMLTLLVLILAFFEVQFLTGNHME